MGGVDQVSKLAEEGDLKGELAQAAGVGASANDSSSTTAATAGGGKSVQDRCKELIKRCALFATGEVLNDATDGTVAFEWPGPTAWLPAW